MCWFILLIIDMLFYSLIMLSCYSTAQAHHKIDVLCYDDDDDDDDDDANDDDKKTLSRCLQERHSLHIIEKRTTTLKE